MSTPSKPELDQALAQARAFLKKGEYGAAQKLLKGAIATDAGYAPAYHCLGQVAVATGHHAHAVPLFQEAVRLDESNAEFINDYARQLNACGDSEAAINALRLFLAQRPGTAAVEKTLERMEGSSPESSEGALAQLRELAGKEQYATILPLAQRLLEEDESSLEARYHFGTALAFTGHLKSAVRELDTVLRRDPNHDAAWSSLGVALMQLRQPRASLAAHEKALLLNSSEVAHHINAGVAYLQFGNIERSEELARQAIQLKGDSPAAIALLGKVAGKRWDYDTAKKLLRKALQLKPGFPPAQGSLVEVLLAEGNLRDTEWESRKLIAADPDAITVYCTLVDALTAQEKYEDALKMADMGAQRSPEDVEIQNRVGICFGNLKRYAECLGRYHQVLEFAPDYFPSRLNLAGIYSQTGQHALAMEQFGLALQSDEAGSDHWSNYIFAHLYDPHMTAKDILQSSREWQQRFFGDIVPFANWKVDVSEDAPLRIGLISGDFRNHPVGYFLESVLRRLTEMGVEVYIYSTVLTEDSTTRRFKEFATGWYRAYKDSPGMLARKVRDDGIQVLIDVAGHTGHNRLSAFARKPAPVQVTWLGYLSTTGLDTMDYIIGDPWVTPAGEEDHFTEQPLPLPRSYQCLTKPEGSLDVSPLPALENGCITFGSFNNFAKLNDPVIEQWSKVLNAVEGSRLLLKNAVLSDPEFRQRLADRFAAHGVDPERLMLEPSRSREHILESYGRVDIGLDPFPYTGCTTTFESLWMGVPVITRTGNRFLAHAGESIMSNLGMPDWIAEDSDQYVALAVERASDVEALAGIRRGMRERVEASPLMDAESFAADLYDALSSVWNKWRSEHLDEAIAS